MSNNEHTRPPMPGPACQDFASLLALVGHEHLDPRDSNRLNQHLATCDYCRRELDDYHRLDAALARHFGPAPHGPLSPADIRALTGQNYRPRTPPPEPAASGNQRSQRRGPPIRPARWQSRQRGRLVSTLSAIAAVLIIAAISLALFESRTMIRSVPPGFPPPASLYVPKQGDTLNSIFMVSPTDGWAVGSTNTDNNDTENLIVHYTGGHWQRFSAPTNQSLHASSAALRRVFMVSANEGWAIGDATVVKPDNAVVGEAFILHYTGGHWIHQGPAINGYLADISMTSATDGWAVGASGIEQGEGAATGLLLHYDGHTWTQAQAPGGPLSRISMTSAADGWITGTPDQPVGTPSSFFLHYNGSRWTQVQKPAAVDSISDLSMVSSHDGWAVGLKSLSASASQVNAPLSGVPGRLVFIHYNGKTWTDAQTPAPADQGQFAIVSSLFMDSPTDGWAVGSNIYIHYSGGKWMLVDGPRVDNVQDVFILPTGEGWAVGDNGAIIHEQNGVWSLATGAATPTPITTPISTVSVTACASRSTLPPGPSGTTVTPVPFSSWSAYTNTKYHYALKYPANWEADNVACADSGSLLFFNYNSSLWNDPGFPPGGIKIEMDAEGNASGLTALQFWQRIQQSSQQGVGGPPCRSFTTRQLQVAGRDAVEGGCPSQRFDAFYIPDGDVMLSISEITAPDGDTSYTLLKQMVASLTFTG